MNVLMQKYNFETCFIRSEELKFNTQNQLAQKICNRAGEVVLLFHTSNSLRMNILRTFAPPKLNCFTADYKEVGPEERNTEGLI